MPLNFEFYDMELDQYVNSAYKKIFPLIQIFPFNYQNDS